METIVDGVCDRFEGQLRRGESVCIESELEAVPEAARSMALCQLIKIEHDCSLERGTSISEKDYLVRFPQDRLVVQQAFREINERQQRRNSEMKSTQPQSSGTEANSTSFDRFAEQVIESGVMSKAELEACLQKMPQRPESGELLAKVLVRHRKLTKFQAQTIYTGKGKQLVLGNYLITEKIGAGGMGQVYKAVHKRMDRVVALKVLPTSVTRNSQAVERFQREARAAAKLSHPNIVTAHDADESKNTHFLVMEFVEGADLQGLVKQAGPMPVRRAVNYVMQAAVGLQFAHSRGIVHRDIKPANLLVDRSGCLKILDLGLAHLDDASADLTSTGDVMGTVDYMAPEQAVNTKHADARSDIYSLGCSLYYLLQGKPVYGGESMVSRIMAHRDQSIPPLAAARDDVPGALELVFQKMVAKDADDRFQSMTEVLDALDHCGISTPRSNRPHIQEADPELQMFFDLQDAEDDAGGVQSAAAEDEYDDTGTEDVYSETVIGTQSRPRGDNRRRVSGSRSRRSQRNAKKTKQREQERRRKRLLWIGGGTLAFLLIAILGIVTVSLKTSAGTIVLKMDQSALAGAKVVIDGEEKLTIDQGEGTEKIEVTADDEKHTLKITKGGFETFTKSFTVKSGADTVIEVWLEPEGTGKSSTVNTAASSTDSGRSGAGRTDSASAGDVDPMMQARLMVVDTRRKQYLAENLPRIQELKAPAPADDRYPEVFPPSQAALAAALPDQLETKYFQDLECRLAIAEDKLKAFAKPYYKAAVDAGGRVFQVESYAVDGKRTATIVGCSAIRYTYNTAGKRTLEVYLDQDGNPVENRERVAVVAHAYENDTLAETRFYKADAAPVDNVFGVHRTVRSDAGQWRRFQLDGTPTIVWLDALNLGKRMNAQCGWRPCLSPDGRELYFSVGYTGAENVAPGWMHRSLWNGRRWSDPKVVMAGGEPLRGFFPTMSSDGSTLYVTAWQQNPWINSETRAQSGGPDGVHEYPSVPNFGAADIYVTRRTNGTWGPVANAGRQINVGNEDRGASISADGKTMLVSRMVDQKPYEIALFNSVDGVWRLKEVLPDTGRAMGPFGLQDRVVFASDREDGFGGADLWMMRRSPSGWERPINLGDSVNHAWHDGGATLTPDGNIMYFCRCCPWNLCVSGRADSEIAVRHMAEIYAWQEWVKAGPSFEMALDQAVSISETASVHAAEVSRPDSDRSNAVPELDAPPIAKAPFDAAAAAAHQQAWADHLGVPLEYTNSIGMKFRLIPPGEYLRGLPTVKVLHDELRAANRPSYDFAAVSSESPVHTVKITRPFYIGTCEVTQSQYTQMTGLNPSYFSSSGDGAEAVQNMKTDSHPVESVTWFDAISYCRLLSERSGGDLRYRLTTEAEWEFACRAGVDTLYTFGNTSERMDEVAWYSVNSENKTHPVGTKKPNAFGTFDMLGNVFEYVNDWHEQDYFSRSPSVDPTGPSSSSVGRRVIRGGHFADQHYWCRFGSRFRTRPTFSASAYGFRVALDVSGVQKVIAARNSTAGLSTPAIATAPVDGVQEVVVLTGHSKGIEDVAYSPEGRYVASSGRDNSVQIWDLQVEGAVRSLPHPDSVYSAKYNHSGTQIVSGCKDGTVRIWNAGAGKIVELFSGHTAHVECVDFSPDGKRVVSGAADGIVTVWELGETQRSRKFKMDGSARVWSVAFSPDGRFIAAGGSEPGVTLWHPEDGKVFRELQTRTGIAALAFSPDAKSLATGDFLTELGGAPDSPSVTIWDVATGTLKYRLQSPQDGPIDALQFSRDGRFLACCTREPAKSVVVWNLASRSVLLTDNGHEASVRGVAFSPNSRYLISGGFDRTLRLRELPQSSVTAPSDED